MSIWNPSLYLLNASARLKPALDLLLNVQQASITKKLNVKKILDLGCGPGNITGYLHQVKMIKLYSEGCG